MSKQLLRCGTSVGAIIREADNAESKKDFIHKFGIAQKEIGETVYWLELLFETQYLTHEQFESIQKDSLELLRLITAILKSAKSRT